MEFKAEWPKNKSVRKTCMKEWKDYLKASIKLPEFPKKIYRTS